MEEKIIRIFLIISFAFCLVISMEALALVERDPLNDIVTVDPKERESIEIPRLLPYQDTFIPNMGQIENADVRYHNQNTMFLDNKVLFRTYFPDGLIEVDENMEKMRGFTVHSMEFLGSSGGIIEGRSETGSVTNFFIGSSENWATGVPTYNEIIYMDLYPGIDLSFRCSPEGMKYEFILDEGARPDCIRIHYEGSEIDTNGKDIFINLGPMTVIDGDLFVFQEFEGAIQEVPAKIKVKENTVTYDVQYDPDRPLVIDPVIYSTFIGGSVDEWPSSIVTDTSGNHYLYGMTDSLNFPTTTGTYSPSYNGFHDNFISKFDPNCTQLLASTYIGGDTVEYSQDSFIDNAGDVIVFGLTQSYDYPTTRDFTGFSRSGNCYFYSKLDPTLSTLKESILFFNEGDGRIQGLDVDERGDYLFSGSTTSTDLPVTRDCYDDELNGTQDGFMMKIDSSMSRIIYCTYFGGQGGADWVVDIIPLVGNEICFGGHTDSNDLPVTSNAFDTSYNSGSDIFLTTLNLSTNSIGYCTYYGGSDDEYLSSIDSDDGINITFFGTTVSFDFPVTLNAFDNTINGARDCIIVKLKLGTNCPVYSTFLGSTENDFCGDLVVWNGNAHLTGLAINSNFPTTQGAHDTVVNGFNDIYYSVLNADGSNLEYSTFMGSSGYEGTGDLLIDDDGNALITGETNSGDFPTTEGAYRRTLAGADDAFLMKFSIHGAPGRPTSLNLASGDEFVSLGWGPPSSTGGARNVSYWVWRGIENDHLDRLCRLDTGTSYNDTNISNGVDYFYALTAITPYGESGKTQILKAVPGARPTEPYGLSAEGSLNMVLLSWSPPNSTKGFPLKGYVLYKGEGGSPPQRFRSLKNITSYEDTSVKNGIDYAYGVCAVNDKGESDLSEIVSVSPGSVPDPISMMELETGNGLISMKWKVPDENGFPIEEYRIYRGENENDLGLMSKTEGDTNTYIDEGLINGNSYYYSVTAVNCLGESKLSPVYSGSPSWIPTAPLLSLAVGDRFVHLSWEPPENDGGLKILDYNVYRGFSIESLSLFDNLEDLELNDSSVLNGERLFYAVSAVNGNGEGPLSLICEAFPCTVPSYP
ncbi:MAG: hypothetical protein ACMUHB_03205, partial [Thermoplasmatota archaeon]